VSTDAAGRLSIDARLGLDKYEIDGDGQPHHRRSVALRCVQCQAMPDVLPGLGLRLVDDRVVARYENCLECGTCQLACDWLGKGGIGWQIPAGASASAPVRLRARRGGTQ